MPSIKLVIWDLDDTLWAGTLADREAVTLHPRRAAIVRALDARGVPSSLCSKNDFAAAKAALERFGLWDAFVFPHIAFTPKPEAIRAIIADMQLRPANVLFVDDNPHNLAAARFLLPELQTLDITHAQADAELEAVVAAMPLRASRTPEYRILERKKAARAEGALSNEAFLRGCAIEACAPYLMDNLEFTGRIAELVNRSNQLNYTGSRVEEGELAASIIDVVAYDSWSIFLWDRYGDYGLVGFVQVDRRTQTLRHFTFSCRAMHMGAEGYALAKAREKWPQLSLGALADRIPDAPADWISDRAFHDPAIRARLRAAAGERPAEAPALRIMFDCQSGGIAHFSAHRAAIEFDNNPRLFALRMLIDGGDAGQHFPPALVYGAGIDYSDARWPGLADLLDGGLYAACVDLFVDLVRAGGHRALIVLPPEQAAEAKYRPHMGHTRARTAAFNACWRRAARNSGAIDLLELDGLARDEEMSDLSHYHAGLLQRLAGQIDQWLEESQATERQAA